MTSQEYRNATVAEIARLTGWPTAEADAVAGDVTEMEAEGLSPSDAASEVLAAAAD